MSDHLNIKTYQRPVSVGQVSVGQVSVGPVSVGQVSVGSRVVLMYVLGIIFGFNSELHPHFTCNIFESTAYARPVRVASLRLTADSKSAENDSLGYLAQVPSLALKRVLKAQLEVLTAAELASAIPSTLDLSQCGAQCPLIVARAVSADLVTHGHLFKLSSSLRLRVMITEAVKGQVLIDDLLSAKTIELLETQILQQAQVWASTLKPTIEEVSRSPLRFTREEKGSSSKKARWVELGLEWIPFKGGQFTMGSLKGDPNERPPHGVEVGPFSLMKTEVTAAQYWLCVQAGACTANKAQRDCVILGPHVREPVNCVSWQQAHTFAEWIGARLPTEAEWELSARGAEGRTYPWGEEAPSCAHLTFKDRSTPNKKEGCGASGPTPPCERARGVSPEGVCDLAGNLWEWVEDDWHFNYKNAPTRGAWCKEESCVKDSERRFKVYKGGSWYHDLTKARGAARGSASSQHQSVGVGFRCAL